MLHTKIDKLKSFLRTSLSAIGHSGKIRIITTTIAFAVSFQIHAQDTPVAVQQSATKPLNFSGYVEAYYGYDFNRPGNNARPAFIYSHNRHNEFNVNLAFLKGSYNTERVRANLAVAVGTYMNANYSAEPGVLKNLYEANAGYKLSASKNLWLDIGIMPSHIGFESAISKDDWTLTRSILAENSPYFESGAKLTYTTNNGKLGLSAMALNGWQRIQRVDSNSLMSWGTQVYYKPGDKITLNYSTFLGTDKPDIDRKWRYFHNLHGIFQFSPKVGLTVGFDYGQEQVAKKSSEKNNWYSPVAILRITPTEKWAIAFRGEYYNDEDGVIISTGTPNGFKTTGLSANIDYMPQKNVAMRLEGKTFHSKDMIFNKEGKATDNNTVLTFSMAVSF